jgi:type IV secretion system protein VirB10
MLRNRALFCFILACLTASAQDSLKQRGDSGTSNGVVRVEAGTHILLSMINSVSTKQAAVGDRIYLETAFPVMANNRIAIPQGSWVTGTVTEVKRPGRVKGRGSLQVRFDSLTLPNGVSRNFHSDLGAIDPRSEETLERENGKVKSAGNKRGDTVTAVGSTAAGTVIGSGVGAAAGHAGMGAGIGAASGAAAGLIGVLTTRGPEAVLTKGSTVEMVLDRPIAFNQSDLDSKGGPPRAKLEEDTPTAQR